ncbi:extracellular solute-binding protein [Klebsiella michiganensis]|nr:extracellular solute-binding protein [Klebsiella michiganensis]
MSLAIAAAPFFSHAEESTWDHIKQSGELRIGVAQGEPWYFKDPATGQWNGIGYNVGKVLAKDLGVKTGAGGDHLGKCGRRAAGRAD